MVRVLLSLISLVSIKTEAITYRHTNGRQDIKACFRSTRLFLDFSSTGVKMSKSWKGFGFWLWPGSCCCRTGQWGGGEGDACCVRRPLVCSGPDLLSRKHDELIGLRKWKKSMLYNISPSEIYIIKTVCSYILKLCYLLEQVQTEWLWASESQPPVCTEKYVLNINRNNTVPQQQPVK